MSSYKLTDNLKHNLKSEAKRLLQIRVAAVSTGFPLTLKQVQAATIPAGAREWLDGLQAMKANSIMTDATRMALIEESDEIAYSVLLSMTLPERTMYLWQAQESSHFARAAFRQRLANPVVTTQMPFDIDTLDKATRTRFVTWVNIATKQARLAHAAYHLIVEFLDKYCASTAELLARWNGLKILFDKQGDPWRTRIRDLPHRNLRNWGWPSAPVIALEWAIDNKERIEVVSGLLAGAALMDTPSSTPVADRIVHARIATWDDGP